MRNWSPNEALPAITERGRTPLTINEGISWLLQEPKVLEPNHCFMTIGSRKPKGAGLDARTPAIWISGGTGHDGPARRGAPKVGWCWAGNRHTWLGFASARRRSPLPTATEVGRRPAHQRPAGNPGGPLVSLRQVTRRRRPPCPSAGRPGP